MHGYVSYGSNQIGTVRPIVCDSAYQISGPSTVTCQNNTLWSPAGECVIRKCPNTPPTIANGFVVANNQEAQVGSSRAVNCSDQYKIQGPNVVICLPNGQWSAPGSCVFVEIRQNSCPNEPPPTICPKCPTVPCPSSTTTTTTTPNYPAVPSKQGPTIRWQVGNWATNCYFIGNNIDFRRITRESCGPECMVNEQCTHYTWSPGGGGICWLRSGAISKRDAIFKDDDFHICGVKPGMD